MAVEGETDLHSQCRKRSRGCSEPDEEKHESDACVVLAAPSAVDKMTRHRVLLSPATAEIDLWRKFRPLASEQAAVEDLQHRRLPRGWAACRTPGGEVYYHCSGTGKSQWAHPQDERDPMRAMDPLISRIRASHGNPARHDDKTKEPTADLQQHSIYDATSRHVDLPTPPTLTSSTATSVRREDLSRRAFALHGLLSKTEAAMYVTSAEASGGFHASDVQHEFPETLRNNSRLVHFSKALAAALWLRLAPQLMHKDIFLLQPMGFTAEGRWKPVGVNPCFRISRYGPHEHFASHRDGMYVNDDGECSIYSLVLYLNDDFEGGELQLERPTLVRFQPRQGSAALFPHDMPHAGCRLLSGAKYIMRSELMFRCVERASPPRVPNFIEDPLWQKMAALYAHVGDLARAGDPARTTEAYQQALGIQIEHHGTEAVSLAASELPLPAVAIAHSLSYLVAHEVLALLPVSIGWQEASKMGRCWRSQFQCRWPSCCELAEDTPSGLDTELKDWFGLYRRSFLMERDTPVCTVFLSSMIHARLQGRNPLDATPAKVSHVESGIGWDLSLKQRIGWYGGSAWASSTWISEGEVDWTALPEFFSHAFNRLKIMPSAHSILIPAIPGAWTKSVRTRMTNILSRRFEISRVHIAPAPLCALLSHGLTTGIVVWICSLGKCAIFCYRDGMEVVASEPFGFENGSSQEIVDLLHQVANKFDPAKDCGVLRQIVFSVHLAAREPQRRCADPPAARPWAAAADAVEKKLQSSEGALRESVILRSPAPEEDTVVDVLKGADLLAASPQLLSAYEVVPADVDCWEWRHQLDDGKWHRLPDYVAGVLEGSFRSGESFAHVRVCELFYLVADFDNFTATVATHEMYRGLHSRLPLDEFDTRGPSWRLTRFLRGQPSVEPDRRTPKVMEQGRRKDAEEVRRLEGADKLHVHTLAGKLVLSMAKSDAAEMYVRDLIEDLSAKLGVPSQQIRLLNGVQPLEIREPLQPLLASQVAPLELSAVVDTSRALSTKEAETEFDEPIPEDVPGDGPR
eukprot:CAMPEP_0115395148 /NCGR_PEP_ID=MMETSP0271-20121206/12635_1 /TAXON_ID=71861 /ORGANISM="Scrippsiella trochoidea, Strain CCMP3099" /LENGTH=1028 /DNA_ID=CAMNT_0002818847 /DNA_START=9 /DNA_END=3092 /DNA_ORIENTATION=-